MKNRKTNKNANGHRQTIRIEFIDPLAASVAIAGSFNDWRPNSTPMLRVSSGTWLKDLALRPGTYEYRLVVDGIWMPDPGADETSLSPFGERNSILKVLPQNGRQQKRHFHENAQPRIF
jgi:1,4-alpha-glucan branching enzyme